jgi:hypothetical protein
METYIVTFSIDKAKNLKEKFEAIVDGLTRLGQEKGSSALALTKTTWGIRSKRSKDYIRDYIYQILSQHGDDGKVFVIEIARQGWSAHFPDDRIDMSKWMKQHVTRDEDD